MQSPWDHFRSLCLYYADCVRYSEKRQEYLFEDQVNETFLLPKLVTPNWHLKDNLEIDTTKKQAIARTALLNVEEEDVEEVFIGYPLASFISSNDVHCLCPILMFPVQVTTLGVGRASGLKLTIDRSGIDLNRDWVDFHIPRDRQKLFLRVCEQSEDGADGIDVEKVLLFISNHFHIDLNPNSMEFSLVHRHAQEELLNTAVLFVGGKTTYTKNLLRELNQIRRESDAALDKTALAYVFREPRLVDTGPEEKKIPVSFTKGRMNAGQFVAVEEALNRHVVKVKGPPGTGKSFMAVNLIANEVLSGGSVLFTSKNHNAIHAIYDKAPGAMENKDFPLVTFCTTPDNPTNADWRKMQKEVDVRLDKFRMLRHNGMDISELGDCFSCKLASALGLYRDTEKSINRYQELRGILSQYESTLSEIDELLKDVPKDFRGTKEFLEMLEKSAAVLEAGEPKGWWRHFLNLFIWHSKVDVREQLAQVAPLVANVFCSRATAGKEARRILRLLKARQICRAWGEKEYEVLKEEEKKTNQEELLRTVKEMLEKAEMVVQKAYLEGLLRRNSLMLGLEDDAEASFVQRCERKIAAVLGRERSEFLTNVGMGDEYEEAVQMFRQFLDVFPAWAATMLSLKRAAPCLPGVFTLAIIDEASQCEIPPMIPVLFRAERVAIVGDPEQFPPVITLKESREKVFRKKYRLDDDESVRYLFRGSNAFSVVPGAALLLNEHFRCADEIARYFNEVYYGGELVLCCEVGRQGSAAECGMVWKEACGGDEAEMEAALEFLREKARQKFAGTIGVISPLRDVANRFRTKVADCRKEMPRGLTDERISTANGFQGGECDIILFLLGLNGSREHGEEWYITASENKYIFNVSVSRAKLLFVAFGDGKRVEASGRKYIQRLIPRVGKVPRGAKVGPGEGVLQEALRRVGIETVAQYPVLNRFLDLAIPEKKIDIEVDGQAFHLDQNGCRKADDVHRDRQLMAAGWRVVRVWHNQVMNEMDECIEKVRAYL